MKYSEYPKPELLSLVIDYLDAYISPRGGWQSIHCVNAIAHSQNDKRASASINFDTGHYKCHACGLAGDGWDLMQQVYHMDFKQAAQALGIENFERKPEEETWITWR